MYKRDVLRQSFLFSCLDASFLSRLVAIAGSRSYKKNDPIFQEGEKACGFYVVAKGLVKVYKLSSQGEEHILHVVAQGESFAEAVVFGGLAYYPAFAQALEDTEALFIPKPDFLGLLRSDFSLVLAVFRSLSEKLKYFNVLVEELSLKEADARLAKYLLDLSLKMKKNIFALDIKKVELARRLGIAPETLSRIFKKMSNQKILGFKKNQVLLFNKEKLQIISSGEKI